MKIAHVISSIDKNSGGTSFYLKQLTKSLVNLCDNTVITIRSGQELELDNNVDLLSLSPNKILNIRYSSKFHRTLEEISCDLFHGNGMWELPVHQMCRVAQNREIPYVLSVHGMLEKWALNQGRLKKMIAMRVFQASDLHRAACIHCTAEMEAINIRSLGFKNPIAVIPNGIDVADYHHDRRRSEVKEIKTLLFLSRLHPKKGLEMLINSWNTLDLTIRKSWKLSIVGNGEPKYVLSLQSKISQLGLNDEIEIVGPKFGLEKKECYNNADLFILPSYSENFGIVIAEALAAGLPVIATVGTPWSDLVEYNAGWWVNADEDTVCKTLEYALSASHETLISMGINGQQLVQDKFSTDSVARDMRLMYEWVTGISDVKPHFIDIV